VADLFIRPAAEADLPAVRDIFNHYVLTSTCTFVLEPVTLDERRQWLKSHGPAHPATVAEIRDEVAGWASLSPWRPRAAYAKSVEFSVYVRHEAHRRGIGRALLADLLVRARAAGHHTVIGGACVEQVASLELQRALGFVEVARFREVGFKFGRWLDVVYMQVML
jgi:L-amino acid N-acyltransferase